MEEERQKCGSARLRGLLCLAYPLCPRSLFACSLAWEAERPAAWSLEAKQRGQRRARELGGASRPEWRRCSPRAGGGGHLELALLAGVE